ncbi:hypothetical protein MRX96_059790 [Rhipicephalus microplus]
MTTVALEPLIELRTSVRAMGGAAWSRFRHIAVTTLFLTVGCLRLHSQDDDVRDGSHDDDDDIAPERNAPADQEAQSDSAGFVNQPAAQLLPAALGVDASKGDTPTLQKVAGDTSMSSVVTVKAPESSPAPKDGKRKDATELPLEKSGVQAPNYVAAAPKHQQPEADTTGPTCTQPVGQGSLAATERDAGERDLPTPQGAASEVDWWTETMGKTSKGGDFKSPKDLQAEKSGVQAPTSLAVASKRPHPPNSNDCPEETLAGVEEPPCKDATGTAVHPPAAPEHSSRQARRQRRASGASSRLSVGL